MTKDEALGVYDQFITFICDNPKLGIVHFIDWLYENGYMIESRLIE